VASDNERIERYVGTHDVSPEVAEAMYEGRIMKGMSKKEVRLTMEGELLSCNPEATDTEKTRWNCYDDDPKFIGGYIVYFKDGEVVSYKER